MKIQEKKRDWLRMGQTEVEFPNPLEISEGVSCGEIVSLILLESKSKTRTNE